MSKLCCNYHFRRKTKAVYVSTNLKWFLFFFNKRWFFGFLLILFAVPVFGQVRDVRQNVAKDRSASSRSSGYSSGTYRSSGTTSSSRSSYKADDDDGIFEIIAYSIFYYTFLGVGYAVDAAQRHTMYQSFDRPELVSLQGTSKAGIDYNSNAFMFNPGIRGNRGLFASELSYLYVNDITGGMSMIDWQVLIVRVPIRSFKMEFGVGFSQFVNPSKTYFDRSVGFEQIFAGGTFILQGKYRWSNRSNIGATFRDVYSIEADYYVTNIGGFRVSPFIGYERQEYFRSTVFSFISLGLKFRLQ